MGDQGDKSFIVEARNLGRRYGRREVLSGIDLQIRRGEIFGILGPD
jgi:ABC-type multidrug transport system ATPase subunit